MRTIPTTCLITLALAATACGRFDQAPAERSGDAPDRAARVRAKYEAASKLPPARVRVGHADVIRVQAVSLICIKSTVDPRLVSKDADVPEARSLDFIAGQPVSKAVDDHGLPYGTPDEPGSPRVKLGDGNTGAHRDLCQDDGRNVLVRIWVNPHGSGDGYQVVADVTQGDRRRSASLSRPFMYPAFRGPGCPPAESEEAWSVSGDVRRVADRIVEGLTWEP